jgi:group I intron endonuclease
MRNYYVYSHTCIVNGKVYIGQTSNPKKRWTEHCSSKDGTVFHRAIRKYGRDKFELRILFESENSGEVKLKEIEFIVEFNTMIPNGYNMTVGGEDSPMKNPEIAAKQANSRRGRSRPDVTERNKRNNPAKTLEARKKMSAAKIGKKCKPFSKQHCERLSESQKGIKKPVTVKRNKENNPMWDPKVVAKMIKTRALNRVKKAKLEEEAG